MIKNLTYINTYSVNSNIFSLCLPEMGKLHQNLVGDLIRVKVNIYTP